MRVCLVSIYFPTFSCNLVTISSENGKICHLFITPPDRSERHSHLLTSYRSCNSPKLSSQISSKIGTLVSLNGYTSIEVRRHPPELFILQQEHRRPVLTLLLTVELQAADVLYPLRFWMVQAIKHKFLEVLHSSSLNDQLS